MIGQTTVSGTDLFPDPLAQPASIGNVHGHPFEFCQRCGYSLTGVLPDANGFGRPDIFLSKRVAAR